MAHPALREVAVLIRDERLVAYFSVRQEAPSLEAARACAGAVAGVHGAGGVCLVDELPLNPAGKLDRKALPEPGLESVVSRAYEAPVGEVEMLMAGIWGPVPEA